MLIIIKHLNIINGNDRYHESKYDNPFTIIPAGF